MSRVFDGEAPETDDEEEELENHQRVPSPPTSAPAQTEAHPIRNSRVAQNWTKLGVQTIRNERKRAHRQQKLIGRLNEQAAGVFSAIQTVAAKLNTANTNIARFEYSIADLHEAAGRIPNEIQISVLDIPQLL
ncbi:unnamed protein product [Caenorhabditis bovis]|uniref:Biogenesis of lysosome-related organelles complex 1 subunit 3 n=1 Tax=Caenorhabditis bovis TaxID=2654633 RepID=A0A8S1F4F0_9PELO|nr:unnamed protein product [Caenorhabditis bovis]